MSGTRYQVFELTGEVLANGVDQTIIHNFRSKREAQKKKRELKKAGTLEGDIWDCKDNCLTRAMGF